MVSYTRSRTSGATQMKHRGDEDNDTEIMPGKSGVREAFATIRLLVG